MKELLSEPSLRSIGWVQSVSPIRAQSGAIALSIGDWGVCDGSLDLDSRIATQTMRALMALGWRKSPSAGVSKWVFVKRTSDAVLKIILCWYYGNKQPVPSAFDSRITRYPINYFELAVESIESL